MDYRCEDLPRFGVVIVPPSSPEYAALLADIENRTAQPIPGSPPQPPNMFDDPSAPTVILQNQSQTGIAALAWIWRMETASGRTPVQSASPVGGASVLVPFGLPEQTLRLFGYWNVILSGSKRAIRGNRAFGNNTDVRLPTDDERWTGGTMSMGGVGGGSRHIIDPIIAVTFVLDGVFFVDGGFAGPDSLGIYEWVTADVAAHLEVARIAQDGHHEGLSPAEIFVHIEAVTGPASDHPTMPPRGGGDFRQFSLEKIARSISMMRKFGRRNDQIIEQLVSWADTPLPKFGRL